MVIDHWRFIYYLWGNNKCNIDMNNPFVTNGYVSARYFCDRE